MMLRMGVGLAAKLVKSRALFDMDDEVSDPMCRLFSLESAPRYVFWRGGETPRECVAMLLFAREELPLVLLLLLLLKLLLK